MSRSSRNERDSVRWTGWRFPLLVIALSIAAASILTFRPAASQGPVDNPLIDTPVDIRARVDVDSTEGLKYVDSRVMLRGYCYAGSSIDDADAPGGFGPSSNMPRKIMSDMGSEIGIDGGGLLLIAEPGVPMTFAGEYRGMRLRLINLSDTTAAFDASDSRLAIVQQALDAKGRWRPVEYLPSSWCGNSYHRLFLASKEYWMFAAPRYTGTMRTRLRFALMKDVNGKGNGVLFVSNEFEGSINPEQFAEKQGHTPENIMNPYDE